MMFWRSTMEIVIMDPKDVDLVEMGDIGWMLSVLATVAAKTEIADLLWW